MTWWASRNASTSKNPAYFIRGFVLFKDYYPYDLCLLKARSEIAPNPNKLIMAGSGVFTSFNQWPEPGSLSASEISILALVEIGLRRGLSLGIVI